MTDGSITLQTDRKTLERLDELATSLERSREDILNQALKAYLDDQAWQVAEIEAGLAELDRGIATPHDEVRAEMADYLRSKAT